MFIYLLTGLIILAALVWLVVSGTVTGIAMWIVIGLAVTLVLGALTRGRP